MSEMIERVARAIARVAIDNEDSWDHYTPYATNSIGAMLYPTKEMLDAVSLEPEFREIALVNWQRMIETALTTIEWRERYHEP
jgi:hypothetical protein